jgi:prepilin-type N-terminal cleavage/methylation domain-containing protein
MFTILFHQEDGFTLIELLVTIAILAALFGIVSLALGGVGANTQSDICDAEYHVVKSAIQIYMAENPGVTLTAGTDTTISNGDGQFADYLRGTTAGLYSWTTDGVLTAGTCPAPASTPPGPCGVPSP